MSDDDFEELTRLLVAGLKERQRGRAELVERRRLGESWDSLAEAFHLSPRQVMGIWTWETRKQ